MPNLRDALNQIAADEAKNSVVATVRNLVSKSADAARQRGGGMMTAPEQLTSNGMLSNLKMQVKLTSSGDTLTLAPVDNGMFPVYGDAGVGWVNCFIKSNVTLSTVGKTSGKLYDVFGYWDQTLNPPNGAMELVEWTSETARSVALLTQDGASLKSTDTSRRFISVVRYNGSTMLVPSIDPNGELFFGTGDPRNNTSDPFSGVGMSAGGVDFDGFVWQFFAALFGVVGVGFNAQGQLVWGGGAVFADALGLLFSLPGTFINFTRKAFINTVYVSTASLMALAIEVFDQDATDVAVNGDAETGDMTGWTLTGTSATATTTEKHSGSYSFLLPDATSSIDQIVNGFSGKHPMAVFWYKGGAVQVQVRILDAASASIFVRTTYLPASTTWVKSTNGAYNDFALGDKAKITFQALSGDDVYIDDIQLLKLDSYAAIMVGDAYSTFNDIVRVRARKLLIGNGSASAHAQALDVRGTSYLGGDVELAGALGATGAVTGSNLSGTNTGDETTATIASKSIEDAINNGTVDKAPSENAVFDALAFKAPLASPSFTGTASFAGDVALGDAAADTLTFNGTPAGKIVAGTYTPTLYNTTNVAASTAYLCQYMRVGNTVTVSGRVDVDPTAAGAVLLGVDLPIASNLGNVANCAGVAAAVAIAGQSAGIDADTTNDRARIRWIAVDVTNQAMMFSFTYQII